MTTTLAHAPSTAGASSSLDMGRTWLRSSWAELLPDEATWIWMLAVTERGSGATSLRAAVAGVDADSIRWLETPLTSRGSLPWAGARPATVEELAAGMEDLGLLHAGDDGWAPVWPLPDPPG